MIKIIFKKKRSILPESLIKGNAGNVLEKEKSHRERLTFLRHYVILGEIYTMTPILMLLARNGEKVLETSIKVILIIEYQRTWLNYAHV